MVHPVPADDFRALRYVLDPEDFALGSEYRDPPPIDLISQEDWEHLVHLPDDVSIRTSSWQGSVLSGLMRLADAWRGLLEFERLQEPLFQMMLNAADDFDASVFNLLHGYYRQSATALRSALEQTVIGTDCQLLGRESELDAWRSGETTLTLRRSCRRLRSQPRAAELDLTLEKEFGYGLIGEDDRHRKAGWVRRLFWTLSDYTHSRPGHAEGDLWSSNGPVFAKGAIDRVGDLFRQVFSAGLLLGKLVAPDVQPPPAALLLWTSGSKWGQPRPTRF